jgi:hypothetical protein
MNHMFGGIKLKVGGNPPQFGEKKAKHGGNIPR